MAVVVERAIDDAPESIKIIMATDGSEAAIDAARRSMDLLRPDAQVTVVTVIPEYEDPMEYAGGIEGPVITRVSDALTYRIAARS